MSAEATGYVYRFCPFEGATFQVHHAIADSVNDQHAYLFWLPLRRLAAKARVDVATAKRAVDDLVKDGFLEVTRAPRPGRNGSGEYRFLFKECSVMWESRSPNVALDNIVEPVSTTESGHQNVALHNVVPSNVASALGNVASTGSVLNNPSINPRSRNSRNSNSNGKATPRALRASGHPAEGECARLPVTWPPDERRMAELDARAAPEPSPTPVIDNPQDKAARVRALRGQLAAIKTRQGGG